MTGQSCQVGMILAMVCILVMTGLGFLPTAALAAEPELRVGEIILERGEIFSGEEIAGAPATLALTRRIMNGLHTRTRAHVLRRELLFHEGDPYRPALLAETERNLRELGYLNNISVAAVDTSADGRVKIRVSVRDSWSLKTNMTYTRAAAGDVRWNITLSEVNFLGQGMTLGAGLGADENSTFTNLWFRRTRLSPAHLVLGVDYSQRGDGHIRNIFVTRPFYSLADRWSFQVVAKDQLYNKRYYLSQAGAAGLGAGVDRSLYVLIPRHEKSLFAGALLRFSPQDQGRLWRVGAGVRIQDQDFDTDRQTSWELSDGRWVDLGFLDNPGNPDNPGSPLAREQGLQVWPHFWLHTEGRRWAKTRFIWQYGPTEDVPLDGRLELRVGPAGAGMGSTRGEGGALWRTEVEATRWGAMGPGYWTVQTIAEAQTGAAGNRYHRANLWLGWMAHYGPERSAWLTRIFAEGAHGEDLAGDRALILGLNRGVRTLDFDGMAGDRLVRWNVEQGKAAPWEVLGLFYTGAAVFYSGGAAWWHDEDRGLEDARHEVGCGLRLGPTRAAGTFTSKLDVSWALNGSRGPVFTAVSSGFF